MLPHFGLDLGKAAQGNEASPLGQDAATMLSVCEAEPMCHNRNKQSQKTYRAGMEHY